MNDLQFCDEGLWKISCGRIPETGEILSFLAALGSMENFLVARYQKFLKRVSEQEFYCIDPSKLKIAMNFKKIDTLEVSHSIKFPIDLRKDLFFPQVAKKT